MMKRLSRIGVILFFMLCGSVANAQETQVVEVYQYHPNYSFWSNWSVGVKGGMTVAADRLGVQQGFNENDPNSDNSLGWALDLIFIRLPGITEFDSDSVFKDHGSHCNIICLTFDKIA